LYEVPRAVLSKLRWGLRRSTIAEGQEAKERPATTDVAKAGKEDKLSQLKPDVESCCCRSRADHPDHRRRFGCTGYPLSPQWGVVPRALPSDLVCLLFPWFFNVPELSFLGPQVRACLEILTNMGPLTSTPIPILFTMHFEKLT
jgi:hypothetical protein